jgi:small subunit ribosomal protein S18
VSRPDLPPADRGPRSAAAAAARPAPAAAAAVAGEAEAAASATCSGGARAASSYKDVKLLSQFVPERGKLLPRRMFGTCAEHQRKLTVAIKRARHIALLPFMEV